MTFSPVTVSASPIVADDRHWHAFSTRLFRPTGLVLVDAGQPRPVPHSRQQPVGHGGGCDGRAGPVRPPATPPPRCLLPMPTNQAATLRRH